MTKLLNILRFEQEPYAFSLDDIRRFARNPMKYGNAHAH